MENMQTVSALVDSTTNKVTSDTLQTLPIPIEFWVIFGVIVAILLYVDLYATDHRKGTMGVRSSLIWSAIWIGTALLFNVSLYFFFEEKSHAVAVDFFTCYVIEKSLSVDNLFVFVLIFSTMHISDEFQPHILKWGIISAVVLRIFFILAGVALINLFHPVLYIFGAILLYGAYKVGFQGDKPLHPEQNLLVRAAKKLFRVDTSLNQKNFFIKKEGKLYITIPFLALLLIESADIMFAVDSIPAVLSISRDPFIVITSNIFAILGLRALYFALAGVIHYFEYLKYGVAFILAFVGVKMITIDYFHISTPISLAVILTSLTLPVLITVFKKKPKPGV